MWSGLGHHRRIQHSWEDTHSFHQPCRTPHGKTTEQCTRHLCKLGTQSRWHILQKSKAQVNRMCHSLFEGSSKPQLLAHMLQCHSTHPALCIEHQNTWELRHTHPFHHSCRLLSGRYHRKGCPQVTSHKHTALSMLGMTQAHSNSLLYFLHR